MTQVHVVPSGETLEDHTLGDCPCGPRLRPILREDGTVIDWVTAHRGKDDDEAH